MRTILFAVAVVLAVQIEAVNLLPQDRNYITLSAKESDIIT